MGTRWATLVLVALLATGCSDDGAGVAQAEPTTDAECAERIPADVFTTLGWTPTEEGATATVRGCHREAEQGYVEVRDRRGDYEKLCQTLDRSGGVTPGKPVDWLGPDITACAVEPAGDVGQTRVLVKGSGAEVTQVFVIVVASTPQEQVRAAVDQLLSD